MTQTLQGSSWAEAAEATKPPLIEFTICWTQGKKQHVDLICAHTLEEAQERLDQIKTEGCVHEDNLRYYIGFSQWNVFPAMGRPRNFSDPMTGRLHADYANHETASAHLDAIKLRGKIHSVCADQYQGVVRQREVVMKHCEKLQEHTDHLEEHIKELVGEIKELKKRKRSPRRKAPARKS